MGDCSYFVRTAHATLAGARQVAVLAKELREGDATLRGRCIVLVGRPQHYHNVSAAARVERTLPSTSHSSSFLRIAATTCFPGWVGIGEVLKDINDLVAHRFIL
jgi:hypothetical protein